jgi:hypothetical protein
LNFDGLLRRQFKTATKSDFLLNAFVAAFILGGAKVIMELSQCRIKLHKAQRA